MLTKLPVVPAGIVATHEYVHASPGLSAASPAVRVSVPALHLLSVSTTSACRNVTSPVFVTVNV